MIVTPRHVSGIKLTKKVVNGVFHQMEKTITYSVHGGTNRTENIFINYNQLKQGKIDVT